ncbi:hypothetical protein I7I48_09436 [Histoplasma ohiense]|nr:hypothetical protein I7I48_09436 [Histoplasma ohiense (nom. inval.)]
MEQSAQSHMNNPTLAMRISSQKCRSICDLVEHIIYSVSNIIEHHVEHEISRTQILAPNQRSFLANFVRAIYQVRETNMRMLGDPFICTSVKVSEIIWSDVLKL